MLPTSFGFGVRVGVLHNFGFSFSSCLGLSGI